MLSVDALPASESSPRFMDLILTNRFCLLAACCVVIGGLLVLLGWSYGIEVLKRVQPGLTAMNPVTAICFVLSGAGVALHLGRQTAAATVTGALVAGIALLKVLDFSLGGVPIDQVLFPDSLVDPASPPTRMALNTTLAFLLVGLSLVLACGRRRMEPLASQVMAAGVLLISVFALIGYGFQIAQLHTVGLFIPMAIHTAVMLLVLSLGLFSIRPERGLMLVLRDRGAAGSMARTILPLAVLIPIVIGAVRLWGQDQGYYGTEVGVALQVIANVLVTSLLLISSIAALYHSDSIRARREQAVARSEAQYRLAESVAKVGHWRMELPSLEMSWSEGLFHICGVPLHWDAPGAAEVLKIYHPDDRRLMRQSVRDALRQGIGWTHNVRICRPGGDTRYVNSQGVCERDDQGNLTAIFGVFADVTELEHARREAEAATTAKAAFLANMSHEIRTPLNGVMGFAELLLTSDLRDEQKRHADLIFESAKTLLKLLNDILDVSKIDAGQMEVGREPFDLPHQLRQCVRLMEATAEKKMLELSLKVDPDFPHHVLGDGLRVRQIILNLLGNAIKFTDRGFVILEAVAAQGPGGERQIRISVADSGVGIAEDRQSSVFQEFVQADASISRRFGGSGLGLSITRRLVGLMGGDLALVSKEGVGTRVTVTLPLEEVDHPLRRSSDRDGQDLAPNPTILSKTTTRNVLLVEDIDINQELLTGMLNRMGHRVEIASNGAEAIKLASILATEPAHYDVIFMDVQMPVLDGLSATRAIRALGGAAAKIPIIALTANAFASEIEECRSAGMDDHVSKPVSMAALGAALTKWLSSTHNEEMGRRQTDAPQPTIADKFALRMHSYAERLSDIRIALPEANQEAREALLVEARKMAHNLAGTAGMCGNAPLGDLAAEIGFRLTDEADVRDGTLEGHIGDLAAALKRAA